MPAGDPLVESAPLARWIAERLCRDNPVLGGNCAWYHGFWQFLRVMDLVTTPGHQAAFYRSAIARAAPRDRPARVLISGAIDYATLAHVLDGCAAQGATADVTVVDVCDTPLFLNLWYAQRVGARVRTVRCDVVEFEAPGEYDAVCTHSFFGQFSPDRRPALLRRWASLLRPGGSAITVNRLRPRKTRDEAGFSTHEARALRETVVRQGLALREVIGLTQDELERCADAYSARRRPHPVSSREEFAALFEQAGFVVESLECAPVATGSGAALTGPTTPGGAEYAQIVARRP